MSSLPFRPIGLRYLFLRAFISGGVFNNLYILRIAAFCSLLYSLSGGLTFWHRDHLFFPRPSVLPGLNTAILPPLVRLSTPKTDPPDEFFQIFALERRLGFLGLLKRPLKRPLKIDFAITFPFIKTKLICITCDESINHAIDLMPVVVPSRPFSCSVFSELVSLKHIAAIHWLVTLDWLIQVLLRYIV